MYETITLPSIHPNYLDNHIEHTYILHEYLPFNKEQNYPDRDQD